jgi:nucleotide-binding universal stress UspA family protein
LSLLVVHLQKEIIKVDQNLVVFDGSLTAQNAAQLAIQIALVEQQKILGLYIVDETLVLDPYGSYQEELGRNDQPNSREQLTEWFEEVGSIFLDQLKQLCDQAAIPVETQILFGGVPELILDNAAGAQVLSLGRRGRGHSSDPEHLGSNFRQIAHHTHIPLFVGGDIYRPVNHLFLLYDGSPHFDWALDWTVRLQHDLSAAVTVAAMDQVDPNKISTEIREQMLQHGLIDYHHRPLRDESIAGILEAIMEFETDLILIGGYHHPEILEWLAGGSIDQILRQSQLPVLIA